MESIIPQIIANSIIAGSLYFIVSAGFNLIFSTTKFFDLGYGGFSTVGGYVVYELALNLNVPIYVSIIIAVLSTGLISYLLEKSIYKKLRQKKASSLVLLIASLGVITVIQAIISMIFTSEFKSLSVGSDVSIFNFGSAILTSIQIWIILSAILIFIILQVILKKTFFGKAVSAISDNEELSKTIGINTEKIIGEIFFLAGGIGAIAGILIGFDTGIEPRMGFSLLLKGIIAGIVGGIGSISGGFLGAYLLGFAENFGILGLSSEWKDAIAFGLLILFLIFRPTGIIKRK